MAHNSANDANRLDLPRINVDVPVSDDAPAYVGSGDQHANNLAQPDNNNDDSISATHTPATLHPSTPSQLNTPTFGRDRSLSGSTAHSDSPLLKPPQSSGGASSKTSSIFGDVERQDALKPDPGSEKDFTVQDNKFAFSPGQLNKLLNPKSLAAYAALGGIRGIEHGLRTDIETGLSVDESNLSGNVSFEEASNYGQKAGTKTNPQDVVTHDAASPNASAATGSFTDRIRVFSNNALPEKKPTPLWKLMWMAAARRPRAAAPFAPPVAPCHDDVDDSPQALAKAAQGLIVSVRRSAAVLSSMRVPPCQRLPVPPPACAARFDRSIDRLID